MLTFLTSLASCESKKEELRRLYGAHKTLGYSKARVQLYNNVDCQGSGIALIYGGNTYSFKCGGSSMPSGTVVNCEHIVPQSFFGKKNPEVCDIHHLYPAPAKLNSMRSNYPFAEFSYDECLDFCKDDSCSTTRPSNPDDYSCRHKDKHHWMPRTEDRGKVARAIFYFMTMYDTVDINKVSTVETLKKWNREHPPGAFEKYRNDAINKSQGNRNPYIDDYTLVDQVF
ncbi:secreted nuclease, putative [Trichomonas vaginalis G3]|uniref:Secreted nuclease, putative n=1 Tax=Trichomonas vaginalis (strain ATCC PRA-98 / G3) TaxID=412133 RepID=A2EM41_TRIV3|nr:endonuclease I family [Trichomonas vaginalis G3]EAY06300.1 secreted nuclease, putative [Trichomonas vaginalis G3]KAI5503378.1 endonuclease I family [Trichomonas vaginalis G3]|eukprot:XP_001318523.1 secreted nuclease [Trichomonas vaginalis G3]